MSDKVLHVCLDGRDAGRLTADRSGALTFTYLADYADDPRSTPLSVSVPLATSEHRGERLLSFLWGLLPDNELVLERWASDYQVSPSSVFGLLSHVGEECAGSVQFVRPDRLDDIRSGGLESLTSADVRRRVEGLLNDPLAWQAAGYGQFSLAGAQPKFALRYDDGRWAIPWGSEPTNVILKPATGRFEDQELNEYICLRLAREIGLQTAAPSLRSFGRARVVCLSRYDRYNDGQRLLRIHQQDLCQALGLRPTSKYQSDGGPSALDVVALLQRVIGPAARAEQAVASFLDALIFNWLIAGTDAHAKNYSLLLSGDEVALAPLYDLTSALPYVNRAPTRDRQREWNPTELKLAMSIGGEYYVQRIDVTHWRKLAEAAGVSPETLVARIDVLIADIGAAYRRVVAEPALARLDSPLVEKFGAELDRHLGLCRSAMKGRPVPRRRAR